MQIMICDDAGFIRELLKNVLQGLGHRIIAEASSGTECIALNESLSPDVIFMDLVLPTQNGLEAAQAILQSQHPTPVIVMSSLEEDWLIERALNMGCATYLRKPFNKDTVTRAMDECFKDMNTQERKKIHG